MQIFDLIGLHTTGHTCQKCVHFQNDPSFVETSYPGLTAMSSGFASVRDQDGFCNFQHIYLSGRDSCLSFTAITGETNEAKAETKSA